METKEIIPCKECIALAMCKHKDFMYCSELYDWVDKIGNTTEYSKTTLDCDEGLQAMDVLKLHLWIGIDLGRSSKTRKTVFTVHPIKEEHFR